MNLEVAIPVFVIICNLSWYSTSIEPSYRQAYHRVATEQECYSLGVKLKTTRAWIYYRTGETLLNTMETKP